MTPTAAPGGLFDSTRRPRRLRVVSNGSWYLAGPAQLEKVGFGELAMADLENVLADLGERVFLAHPEVRPLEDYMRQRGHAPRRISWFERLKEPVQPTLAAVARGAQVAVLPVTGIVWVDGEGLFRREKTVPLPWTDPLVQLPVVQPRVVVAEMRRVIGPSGPRRVRAGPDGPGSDET